MDIAALREELVGPLTALVTPMTTNGDVDLDAVAAHVDFQVDHGVSAIVVNGTIGEASSLSTAERKQLAEAVVHAADGRTRTLVSPSHDCWPDFLDLTRHAAAIGADALLVSLPPFFKLAADEQQQFWERVAGTSPLPFVVYCSSHSATPRPSVESLMDVAGLPGFLAVKESLPDVSRIRELVERLGPDIPVIAAGEKTLPDAAMTGAAAAMTATACFAPQRIREILVAAGTGQIEAARSAFEPIGRFRALFQDTMDAGYPSFIPYTKAACHAVGLPTGPPRPPLRPPDPDHIEQVHHLVHDVLSETG